MIRRRHERVLRLCWLAELADVVDHAQSSIQKTTQRLVTGLLRACADIVLIGAGTLRATPGQ